MKAHFDMMAAYNAWANGRLYDAAHALPDEEYRRDLGAAALVRAQANPCGSQAVKGLVTKARSRM